MIIITSFVSTMRKPKLLETSLKRSICCKYLWSPVYNFPRVSYLTNTLAMLQLFQKSTSEDITAISMLPIYNFFLFSSFHYILALCVCVCVFHGGSIIFSFILLITFYNFSCFNVVVGLPDT